MVACPSCGSDVRRFSGGGGSCFCWRLLFLDRGSSWSYRLRTGPGRSRDEFLLLPGPPAPEDEVRTALDRARVAEVLES